MDLGSKKKAVAGLVIVWVVIIAYNFWPLNGSDPDGDVPGRGIIAGKLSEGTGAVLPELRLELLEESPPAYTGIKRDIFSPVKVYVPKPPPKIVRPAPVKKPPSPIKTFVSRTKFAGFVEQGAVLTVFLSRGDDIFLIKEGDLVDGRFHVVSISPRVLRFEDSSTHEVATIAVPEE